MEAVRKEEEEGVRVEAREEAEAVQVRTSSGLDTARRSLLTCNHQDRPLATAAAPPALPPALVYVQRMARVEDTTAAELQFHTKPD